MLRWHVAGSVFAGIVMLMTCLCQASGKALPALALSLSRQGLLFAAVLLTASAVFGYDGIIASQCVADFLSALLAGGIFMKLFRRKI
jgi:Na+-driven multidrug efflux pump